MSATGYEHGLHASARFGALDATAEERMTLLPWRTIHGKTDLREAALLLLVYGRYKIDGHILPVLFRMSARSRSRASVCVCVCASTTSLLMQYTFRCK